MPRIFFSWLISQLKKIFKFAVQIDCRLKKWECCWGDQKFTKNVLFLLGLLLLLDDPGTDRMEVVGNLAHQAIGWQTAGNSPGYRHLEKFHQHLETRQLPQGILPERTAKLKPFNDEGVCGDFYRQLILFHVFYFFLNLGPSRSDIC